MRINEPVTNNEVRMKEGTLLVTRTNLKGIMTFVNPDFIEISGFSEAELIGKNHNMVRHPDMPPEAFEDLWNTIKDGKPWVGLVKNRTKSGDYYWVQANVTPMMKNGKVEEYMSVRTPPTREQVSQAEMLYGQMNAGKASLKPSFVQRLNVFKKMKVWQKLSMAGLVFFLVAAALVGTVISMEEEGIRFAKKEIQGVQYLHHVRDVMEHMPKHRGMANAYLSGQKEFKSKVIAQRAIVDEHLNDLREYNQEFAEEFHTEDKLKTIINDWDSLKSETFDLTVQESFKRHTDLLEKLIAFIAYVADQSNLILDPELDTFYLMDILVNRIPVLTEKTGQLRGLGASIINNAGFADGQENRLNKLEVFSHINEEGVNKSMAGAIAANKTIERRLAGVAEKVETALGVFDEDMQKLFRKEFAELDGTDFFNKGTKSIEASFALYDEVSPLLEELLHERIGVLRAAEIQAAVVALLGLLIAVFISWYVTRDLLRALGITMTEFEYLSNGNFARNINIKRIDEIGDLMRALKVMQIKMGFDVNDTRQRGNDMARIKVALDNVNSCVMMADNRGDIIYMNKAVLGMMKNAEAEIRTDLPNFDADKLVGANFDSFHKKPEHQRQLIASLKTSYETRLVIGGRTFDLAANPVVNEKGERLGTAVEWVDRTAEVAVEKEVESIVQAARDGDLDQRISMEGKEGFFKQLAEGINKLIETVAESFEDVAFVMESMSKGDLTNSITKDYTGTYGVVKDSINATIAKLQEVVGKIRESSEFIRNSSEEISAGNNNLSQRAEEQASTLEETASSMEELTSTVKNNADNAVQANQLASGARDLAEKGGNVVKQAVEAMNEITASSNKIAEIIGVIDEIAFQTNLLALNASVEAARAGEQGRGFAVVATEVRNLAQRSATAAKEIKDLISDSGEKVEAGGKLVNESGVTLNEIVDSVKKVGDIISEIAAASQEQSAGIEQVNKAVTQMDEITQQNAALAEEASASSESSLHKATEMNNLVSFFRVDASTAAVSYSPEVQRAPAQRSAPVQKAASKPTQKTTRKAAPQAPVDDDEWEEF
ncbi:MAG: methyl-accepting chemotaxis protein [Gammaproteobacteria bacterium]|nr:methyl-accepting chemotaxis protein [Gammaproteobacteria bacterium]